MAILLSKSQVASILDMRTTIEIVEKAFAELYEGTAVMPLRTPILVPNSNGVALFMPAYMKNIGALGAKIVTVFKDNPKEFKLPTVLGTITILDEKTGKALSIMDGGFITAMRTGAVSGIATKYMANPDAKIASIIGSGIQAKAQVWATCEVKKFDKYYVFSLDHPDNIDNFCSEMQEKHNVRFIRANAIEEAVCEADVLTLATSAANPIIDGDWIKSGCHINGIGAHAPLMREIDEKTILKSRIIADQTTACLAEAGDIIIPIKEGKCNESIIKGDLGGVITGRIAGRDTHSEITIFKSVGLAIQDVSTALAVYKLALDMKVGTDFDFIG